MYEIRTWTRFTGVLRDATKKIYHTTQSDRQKEARKPQEEVAAARSSKPIERRVLVKQARKARAEFSVTCSLMLGKRISKRKPLTELYVNVIFTEDRRLGERTTETL